MQNENEIKKAMSIWEDLYKSGKQLLEDLLVKPSIPVNVTCDMVKTFEDACYYDKKDPVRVLPYPNPQDRDEEAVNAYRQTIIIMRVLNGPDWKPDYSNNLPKWRMWMNWDKSVSAFRFNYANLDYEHANAGTGVRLDAKTKEIAEYFGRQFPDIINKMISH